MQRNDEQKAASFLSRALRLIAHNWPWKLLSLFLALCMWSMLITQDDTLPREKVFNDVPINVTNAETLRRNGYIIVSGLEELGTVRIKADVPQKMYHTVTAANFNVRVDLSRVTGAGEQTLNILTTATTTYGTVTDISLSTVDVVVEEYISRSRIPVRIAVSGEAPDGFYAAPPSVDPAYVTVSGPKSQVNTIVRCVADYDMALLAPQSGVERSAVPFYLLDVHNNVVDRSFIEVTTESVLLDSLLLEQRLYVMKELVINTAGITAGSPAEGYVIRSVQAEPASLIMAGSDALMNPLNALNLTDFIDAHIDVTDAADTIRRSIRIEREDDIAYISQDAILITVNIGLR